MRSVAMCGWRTMEIKALPEEIFDLFACLFKRVEESQIWPEILLQVVTTFIPKVDDEDLDRINQKKLSCAAPEEMRPINNASPWYSIYTSLRYEQMENWRNEVMPSSMHGARKGHGVWDVSFEHMLEMEVAVERDPCLGALSLDWSKFFDSLERDVGNSLVQFMRDSNALGYVQAEQGPCYSIEVALMMMSVCDLRRAIWTRDQAIRNIEDLKGIAGTNIDYASTVQMMRAEKQRKEEKELLNHAKIQVLMNLVGRRTKKGFSSMQIKEGA